MWDLAQYMPGNLAFNGFMQCLSEGGARTFGMVLIIFCRFFSIYLVARGLEKPTIGSTKNLSWLDSRRSKDFEKLLEMHSLRGRPQSQIEVILLIEVEQSKF